MVLTTGLSRPFRQLERLAGAIQVRVKGPGDLFVATLQAAGKGDRS